MDKTETMEAPAAPSYPADGQALGTTSHWLESLPEDAVLENRDPGGAPLSLREHPKLRQFRSVADLARSYLHQEHALGRKARGLAVPADDAPDEERAAFEREWRKALRVPEAPEGYALRMPRGVAPDNRAMPWFNRAAHGVGLSPAQAQGLLDRYHELETRIWSDERQRMDAERAEAVRRVHEHFRGQAAESVELAKRGFETAAGRAGLDPEEARAFAATYGDNLTFLRVFAHLGRQMQEDGMVDGSGHAPGRDEAISTEEFYRQLIANADKE
ncbi:MAG: hypothetical protein AB1916_16580 [Thermodesulfobacteriota bacterium]